jgi:SAM-dependent methyltransferase
VVCRQCGFCFTSPGATAEALNRYYADGLTGYKGIALPYSIERRLQLLERYRAPSGVFVEIGGDRPEEFHRHCTGLFGTILNVDMAEDTSSDYRSVEELPFSSVDVIAHYDVLEHVPSVRGFLTACHRALKDGGVMVCEVPDVRLYPRNLILLEFEHVNHFSVVTLAAIAQACGFKLIGVEHICSRPFGFVSVFCKDRFQADHPLGLPFEYLDTLACVQGGVEQIQRVLGQIRSLQKQIIELGNHRKRITLWGVTDLLRRLLENFTLPDSAIVVDSDPRRSTHLESEGIAVFQPKDCQEHIKSSDLLVIFAPRYKAEILEWIFRETGRQLNVSELEVIGSGFSGESLM